MTANTHPSFLAFCRQWQHDGRCPLPFVDWLIEMGLDGQAEGARWCCVQPDRKGSCESEGDSIGGIRPFLYDKTMYVWNFTSSKNRKCFYRSDVSQELWEAMPDSIRKYVKGWRTFPEAIAAFLDAWAAVRCQNPVGVGSVAT